LRRTAGIRRYQGRPVALAAQRKSPARNRGSVHTIRKTRS